MREKGRRKRGEIERNEKWDDEKTIKGKRENENERRKKKKEKRMKRRN